MEEAASRAQLERVIETIAEGIYIVNADGIIVYANKSAEEILGVKKSDLFGRPYGDPGYKVTTLEGKPYPLEERPAIEALRTGRQVRSVEYAVIRPDGRRVIISANAAPIRDDKGKPISVILSFADITTRKQAEEDLKESERRFREMLEGVELIAIILDTQGNIMFANDFLLDLTGWQREDVIGKNWFELFIPPEERQEIKRVFNKLITQDVPAHYENDIVTIEEERRTIAFSNVTLRDRQGNVTGAASFGHDITAEKQAAQEISESRRQVLDILESITDGFFALDNLWRFNYVNRRATQLIGKKKEQLLFRNMWEVLPELKGTKFDEEYHRAKEKMVPTTFDAFYPPLKKWFEVHAYPYANGLSAYVSDVTERKRIEEALKESENRYRTLFEDSPIALWEQDASEITVIVDELKSQGVKDFRAYFEQHPEAAANLLATIKIIDVNKATLELYGASSKEEFIKNFAATFTKEGLDAAKEFLIALAERGEVKFEAEFTSRTFKGDLLYVSVISFIPSGYEETRSKIFITTIDITERKKAEEVLKESEARFRKVFEEGPLGMAIEGLDYRFVKVNARLSQMLGYTEQELTRLTFPEITYPDDIDKDVGFAQQMVRGELPPYQTEKRYIKKNGELFWASTTVSIVRDEKGNPLYFLTMVEDIEDRKRAEIDNSRLFGELTRSTEELDKRSKRLQTLLDVALDMTSGLKLDELMYKIARNAAELTGADVGAVGLVNEETRAVTYPFIYNLPEYFAKTEVPPGRGMGGLVVSRKKTLVLDDYQAFNDKIPRFAEIGLRSIAMVPLWSRGRIIGLLWVSNLDPGEKLDERAIATLEGMGRYAAIALENARLYGAERHIADTLQDALLTVPEKVNHLEYGHFYRSATEAARIGGDFYDLFEMEHNKIGLMVGDVSGKGLEAAALTAVAKNTIRAYALEGYDPAYVMAKTNDTVRMFSDPSTFITAIFAIFDKVTKRLTYCNAGHPPAIIKRKNSSVDILDVYSPIIGAFAGLRYYNGEVTLDAGEILVLYTDGVIEARSDGKFFEEHRLIEFVKGIGAVSAKEVPQLLLEEVLRFTGGRLSDDVVVFTLAYKGI
ncbi:MAG: SpoIIE family protein phosphatase [Candidatus Aquicultor sp.]